MLPLLSSLYWKRYLRRNTLPVEDFSSFARLSPNQRKAHMAGLLLRQIQYFGRRDDALSEWREAASISDPGDLWKIWPSLPIISKDMLRSRFPAGEMAARFGIEGNVLTTGGSTGEPTRFFHDTRMLFATTATDIHTRARMGWKPGMPTIILWGSERDVGRPIPAKLRWMRRALNEYLIDGYHLDDSTIQRVREVLGRHRHVAMFGFTSMLEFVARRFLEAAIPVRPGQVTVAWNGGEMLLPGQIDIFRQAFHTTILNRYGGRELGAMACQTSENGPLEILRPWIFLEILNDKGQPASPGESGRVVCTSTICRGTPFLRYEIEDAGVYQLSDQEESGLKSLSRIEGRLAGILRLPDGRQINCIFWNHLFKDYSEIEQFQIVLKQEGNIEILTTGKTLPDDRYGQLRAVLDDFLGSVPYKIRPVLEIPRTARGKLMQVVRET